MKSIYASDIIKQEVWPDFTAHFKSSTTKGSYRADINEIMEYFRKDFFHIRDREVKEYFEVLKNKVEQGEILPGTMAKKFRELHSFAEYICGNREKYAIDEGYEDYYYPYLKLVAGQEKYVRSVPVGHMDKLLDSARHDIMAYCILVLLYRAGLTSTEIAGLLPEDFGRYDNGVYARIKGRRNVCYIPEDAAEVLEQYMNERKDSVYLFSNKRGNPLNTMYISRMLKKYAELAGIPAYSAERIRSTCGVTLSAYGAAPLRVAEQMGITTTQIRRYQNISYREHLLKEANDLVRLRVTPPDTGR